MGWIDPRAVEHRRKMFTRHDAYRWAPPGTPEAKMPGCMHPWAAVARAEEAAKAEAAEREAFEQELLELRRDLDEVKHALALRRAAHQREIEEARVKSDIAFERFLRAFERHAEQQKAGFNPEQPRDDHGTWTDTGQGDAGKDGPRLVSQPSAMRRGGPRMPATPAQQARLAIADARTRQAVARVRQLDPT